MILTDQSRHAVELRVIRALSLPRFHFPRLQMEDLLLRWENQTETAINLALFILSHAIPPRGQERGGKCAARGPGAAPTVRGGAAELGMSSHRIMEKEGKSHWNLSSILYYC